jgi:hypothetical protein
MQPTFRRSICARAAQMVTILLVLCPVAARARITRIVIDTKESPAFQGRTFGAVGAYEKVIGRAYGELDSGQAQNAIITDIKLAPRNKAGKVEYETSFYLIKPVEAKHGNGLLYYNVVNRGNKGGFDTLNLGVPGGNDPTDPGDGFALKRGYTFLWSGWQPDVLPGNGRMTMKAPVARNADGSEITGKVRAEYIVIEPVNTLNLSSGTFTGLNHASYETVSMDTTAASLTYRIKETDPRVPIAAAEWAFADCGKTAFPGVPSSAKICLKGGFNPNFIYELMYTAKDPLVLGVGLAATRDLVSFFRHADRDDAGTANPLANELRAAIMEGSSQSGRFMRTFLNLGFNQDEGGKIVFEGMNPHIATGMVPINVRFGQPGRGYGQHEEHSYPAHEAPFTWSRVTDAVSGRTAGLLDRCGKTNTCPKIMQTVSSTEYWQGRMAVNTTDGMGQHDVDIPSNVRIYHIAGTQHGPASQPSLGICQQLSNDNPNQETRRALLVALEQWISKGTEPPASRYPTLKQGSLVAPDAEKIGWPKIPGVRYNGLVDELDMLDFGKEFIAQDESGILAEPPVIRGKPYVMLVPKVDADGNEIDGVHSTKLQAPIGTYSGWNLRRSGFAEGELCGLQGSFIPFRKTKQEREEAGDPRPSLEERYRDHDGYAAAVKAAATKLVSDGFLLPEDASRLADEAAKGDILK